MKTIGVIPKNTKLAPRHEAIKAWNKLSDNERKLFSRQAEVFAGFMEMTDYEVGRLYDAITFIDSLSISVWYGSTLTLKVLFDSHDQGLVETRFGVAHNSDALFASIERYDSLLEEKGAWYSFQIFKQLVTYLIIGLFAALYAIFTI